LPAVGMRLILCRTPSSAMLKLERLNCDGLHTLQGQTP
jgi:hypothetical protein